MRLNRIAQTLDGEVGKAHHSAALGHVEVTDTTLVDDGSQHVLDELRSLGNLIETHEDRLAAVDPELVVLAHTEALVG